MVAARSSWPTRSRKVSFRWGCPSPVPIDLGDKASVHLKHITPRSLRGQAVGCQFEVSGEGVSKKYLVHLMASLEKAELDRYRT